VKTKLTSVSPAEGEVLLSNVGTFKLTVDADDEVNNLRELEIDHSMEGSLPEFSVYADETNPYGDDASRDQFIAQGVLVTYDPVAQEWTIDFGKAISDAFVANGGITFYLVLIDDAGNELGSMSPTNDDNTFAYTLSRAEPAVSSGGGGGGGGQLNSSDNDDGDVAGEQDTDGDGQSDSSDDSADEDGEGQVLGVQDNGDEITDEELRDLLAQAKQALLDLAAQIGGENDYRSCSYVWTRDLGQGAQGADVMNLQKFLNMNANTRVALSGVGSAGQETSYYGPLTAAAVSKFQSKHASQILTPLSLTQPTGYFGGSSRAQSRVLCASDNN
jgi:hypothetical protein